MRKRIRTILDPIESIVLLCLSLFAVCLIIASVRSVTPYIVMSGSMEPAIHTGSLVLVDQKISAHEIQAGDIIGYRRLDDSLILHRVVEIQNGEFITKGDNNDAKDLSPVKPEQYIGKCRVALPYMGYMVNGLKDRRVMLILGISIAIYLFIKYLLRIEKKKVIEDEED